MRNVRRDFPILEKKINNHQLIYFDNASTTQKPISVINGIADFYKTYNANPDRGWNSLGSQVSKEIELARNKVARFINAINTKEIVFTSGTTESINLIASTYGNHVIKKNDIVLISELEHHSNIYPWQELVSKNGGILKKIPIDKNGDIDLIEYEKLLHKKPKIVAMTLVSNVIGTTNPIKNIVKMAHKYGAKVLVDAAQAVSHIKLDIKEINCDFLVFSAHKMYGPTGIGILYAKQELMTNIPPYKYGGGMVQSNYYEKVMYRDMPQKLESGTLNIAGIIGLKKCIEYIENIGYRSIFSHENSLLTYALNNLKLLEKVKIIGNPKIKSPLISFIIKNMHNFDVGIMLDAKGIIVRTGKHCANPLINILGLEGTIRISFGVYNTKNEIDIFVEAIKLIIQKNEQNK